jgi:hypothetical protein
MRKQIQRITPLQFKQNAPGFLSVDLYHNQFNIEPFLVFTEFHMDRPIFGPHPHAGVSVMTYMLPDSKGSFINRDSLGDHSIIEPGGIHVTQAGSGVKHDEVPLATGKDCHGFQIWINHADKDRLVAPKAFHAAQNEVPEYKTDQYLARVLQGSFLHLSSPIKLVTSTSLLHIILQPHSHITLPANTMAFVYLIKGTAVVQEHDIATANMVTFSEEGDEVTVSTTGSSAELMFASGTPHQEPIVYGGPFVMTTDEQMRETKLRLGRGEMGELEVLH